MPFGENNADVSLRRDRLQMLLLKIQNALLPSGYCPERLAPHTKLLHSASCICKRAIGQEY